MHVLFFTSFMLERKNVATKTCRPLQQQPNSPSIEIVIYSLRAKSISEIWFSCSMGSTRESVSCGAWEAYFRLLLHRCSETIRLFDLHWRGVSKISKCVSSAAWEAPKNMRFTEHESKIQFFGTLLDWYWQFEGTRKVISGSGRFWPVLTGFALVLNQKRSDLGPPNTRQAQGWRHLRETASEFTSPIPRFATGS